MKIGKLKNTDKGGRNNLENIRQKEVFFNEACSLSALTSYHGRRCIP